MKLLLDDANIKNVEHIYEYYPIDGVTTNPSILAKCGRQPYEALRDIRAFIGEAAELHVQVLSERAEDILREADKIVHTLGEGTYVKIPTVPEGLKAMKKLASEGFFVTATTIYTPLQAYLAAKAGAKYAAPYVNRIDNLGANGVETIKMIQKIFEHHGLTTEVLAASFKNANQVQELCAAGIGAATLSPDVIENMIKNASVSTAVNDFIFDFEKLCGQGKTMLNCED